MPGSPPTRATPVATESTRADLARDEPAARSSLRARVDRRAKTSVERLLQRTGQRRSREAFGAVAVGCCDRVGAGRGGSRRAVLAGRSAGGSQQVGPRRARATRGSPRCSTRTSAHDALNSMPLTRARCRRRSASPTFIAKVSLMALLHAPCAAAAGSSNAVRTRAPSCEAFSAAVRRVAGRSFERPQAHDEQLAGARLQPRPRPDR